MCASRRIDWNAEQELSPTTQVEQQHFLHWVSQSDSSTTQVGSTSQHHLRNASWRARPFSALGSSRVALDYLKTWGSCRNSPLSSSHIYHLCIERLFWLENAFKRRDNFVWVLVTLFVHNLMPLLVFRCFRCGKTDNVLKTRSQREKKAI